MKRIVTILMAVLLVASQFSADAQNKNRKDRYIPLSKEERANMVTLGRSVVFFEGRNYTLGELELDELREMVKLCKGHNDYLVQVFSWCVPSKDADADEYFTFQRARVVAETLIKMGMNKNLIVEIDGKGGDPSYKTTGDSFMANRAEVCVIRF